MAIEESNWRYGVAHGVVVEDFEGRVRRLFMPGKTRHDFLRVVAGFYFSTKD